MMIPIHLDDGTYCSAKLLDPEKGCVRLHRWILRADW